MNRLPSTRGIAETTTPISTKHQTLSDAIKGSRKLPTRLVIHGQAGVGKTEMGFQAPGAFGLLSPGETGVHSLMDIGKVSPEIPNIEVADWPNVMGILDQLRTTDHKYKTLVVDTLDELEKLCNSHVCNTLYGGDMGPKGFLNFHVGYRNVAQGPWREFLAALDRLRERPMNIVLLCHTEVTTFRNPEGLDYNRFSPAIYKDAWSVTFGWADIVLFAQFAVHVAEDKSTKKGKASGGVERFVNTQYSATADAKNRHGLLPTIDMGENGMEAWANFIAALAAGRKNGKDQSDGTTTI